MALIPHYVQSGGEPVVTGEGFGVLGCDCGQSLLIAGYEPRNFLGIAIRCSACERITETPGLPQGAPAPPNLTLIERGGSGAPRAITSESVLVGREEMERLAALYQPRSTDTDPHVISDALLDDLEFQQRRWTNAPLDPAPKGYKHRALAWAVAHYRARLRDPDWTSFVDDTDLTAVTVIAAFRDLFASWVHHPLFGAMIGTAAAQGFSLHAMAMFGAAKSLASAGNRVAFMPADDARAGIGSFQLVTGPDDQLPVSLSRFDRFEWPDGAVVSQQAVRAAVIEAIASAQGRINRLRPGILVLSPGASDPAFDQLLVDGMTAVMASHGKRNRGMAAVAAIFPKVFLPGRPREVRFGYTFFPVGNRNHVAADQVRIGTRTDYSGLR